MAESESGPRRKVDLEVDGRTIEVRRPDKLLFPDSAITKLDLARYYAAVARWMLPHLEDRPLTLKRYPDGIAEDGFYQKEASTWFPEWIETVEMEKEGGLVRHVVCRGAAPLVYLATQATITFHVWLSRSDRPRRPDRMIFDLDPPTDIEDGSGEVDVAAVRRAAGGLRDLLADELGLHPYLMGSGSRGLHVGVAIERRYPYDFVRDFARDVATVLVARDPEHLTLETRKANRRGRIFVDVLRNGYAQTAVAPLSVRALPGAPVAMPLSWSQLRAFEPRGWGFDDALRQLRQRGDPIAAVVRSPSRLEKPRRSLDALL